MKTAIPIIIMVIGLIMSGCTASINETHYFASFNKASDTPTEPVNFFRLKVHGSASFSSARYLTGFYDERAVDLFFNEIRSDKQNNTKLFDANLKEPVTQDSIKPLSPSTSNGAYVLIMSTSADSIANAIGSFAESEVVAEAITNLIAKEKIKEKIESDAEISIAVSRGTALESQLSILLSDAKTKTGAQASKKAYLRVLNALGRSLGHNNSFESFENARQWFQIERNTSED
jgi:hypothetical protein